jgi:hypothetical protein
VEPVTEYDFVEVHEAEDNELEGNESEVSEAEGNEARVNDVVEETRDQSGNDNENEEVLHPLGDITRNLASKIQE